jgi:hypothetical protein
MSAQPASDSREPTTLDELLADPSPICSVPAVGAAVYGVRDSQSYVLAAAGVIPTKKLGPRRVVVLKHELAASLGIELPSTDRGRCAPVPDATNGAPASAPHVLTDPGGSSSDACNER